MKQLIIAFVLLLFFRASYAQKIEFGKYRLCYDMYWRCHFQNLLELRSDSTYEFVYLDDTQMEKTTGTWYIEPDFLVLAPLVIPDTIKIWDIFETKNKDTKFNQIEIFEHFTEIKDIKITLYQKGKKISLMTDSVGQAYYMGNVADSLFFKIKERELKIIPENRQSPSIITIRIDSNYRDLVYRQLGTNKIMIQDGKMFIRYRDRDLEGKVGELKTEYFEKINK